MLVRNKLIQLLITEDFIDKEFLAQQKETGITRKLVAFEMTERGIPRHDYPIQDGEGNVIGRVTSGTMSPSMKMGIGLGYVKQVGISSLASLTKSFMKNANGQADLLLLRLRVVTVIIARGP